MTTGKMDVDFVQFLDSMINLDALDRMTRNLDDELKDSQVVMDEIKGMINSLPAKAENVKTDEDISNFMSDGTPKLLMPDMDDKTVDVDLDNIIATMKLYTEELKRNFTQSEVQPQITLTRKDLEDLDLEQYASSLDHLCKRLSNLKLNKKDEMSKRNAELEAKLSLLCDDVNMFTKMVQAKTTLSEANKNCSPTQPKTHALDYDNLINKLLSGINEVSYLLQNKN